MEKLFNIFYGNNVLHQMLTNSVICEHLCHAYLFYGEKGVGKLTLAVNFAAQILCKEKSENKPCFECRSCKKLLSGSHPDVFFYGNKDEQGGKNTIHIDDVRQLRQDAFILPNESEYKIYIIQDAEDMTIAAGNAFLKILEEPPKHAMFILTATSKTAVFETILSRCIPFELFPLEQAEEKKALTKLFPDIDEKLILAAADFSGGYLGRAISFLNDENAKEIFANIKDAALALASRSEYELLLTLHKANTSKTQMLEFISGFISVLRNACVFKVKKGTSQGDETVLKLAGKLTQQAMYSCIEKLSESKKAIESNINMGLLENYICVSLISCL